MATIKPTRQELLKLRNQLSVAKKGHKLLKDKRDGLTQKFLSIVKESLELRKNVDPKLIEAINLFGFAQAKTSSELIDTIASNSNAQIFLQVNSKNIMGVNTHTIHSRVEGNPLSYGMLDTPKDLDESILTLKKILPDLLKLAELEYSARKLAEEIEKTRRRVNGLEHVIIPQMNRDFKFIRAKLEETARQEKVTLLKIKEQVVT